MFEMIKKFFDFCNSRNRKKLYKAVALGVLEAVLGAMKIPAAFFAIKAVVEKDINTGSILLVIGLKGLIMVGTHVHVKFH